jgi:type III restriction enzyme
VSGLLDVHQGEVTKGEDKKYDRHLYVDDDRKFAAKPKLNEWEDEVISKAIESDDVAGWLRNDPRKPWALSVPYKKGAEDRPMYPDFLVFRRHDGGILCDIYEPHSPAWADSVGRAKGLAEFAKSHGDDFGDIELIAKLGGKLRRLPLNDPETRDKILAVGTSDELQARFEEV